jgi:hypothetical protein
LGAAANGALTASNPAATAQPGKNNRPGMKVLGCVLIIGRTFIFFEARWLVWHLASSRKNSGFYC